MHRVEAKLNPGIILIVDDDARRRDAIIDAVTTAFESPVIKPCTWDEHDRACLGVRADLVILAPDRQKAGEIDRLEDVIRSLGSTPTMVLTDAAEPQRAVNAVLEGASDAMVMEPSFLQLLPSRLKKTFTRSQYRPAGDRRAESPADLLRRTRQENDQLRTRIVSLRAAALLDPLTGLGNRRALDVHLARLWDAAALCDTDISCLVVDIDNFKRVNDAQGHAAGDRVLALLARVLLEQCRQDDVAARLGGDEFIVLLPGASTEQGEQVAARIQRQFDFAINQIGRGSGAKPAARTASASKSSLPALASSSRAADDACTLSIGVASRKRNRPACPDDLIVHADEAMYIAKRSGKNRVELCVRTGASTPRLASAG